MGWANDAFWRDAASVGIHPACGIEVSTVDDLRESGHERYTTDPLIPRKVSQSERDAKNCVSREYICGNYRLLSVARWVDYLHPSFVEALLATYSVPSRYLLRDYEVFDCIFRNFNWNCEDAGVKVRELVYQVFDVILGGDVLSS